MESWTCWRSTNEIQELWLFRGSQLAICPRICAYGCLDQVQHVQNKTRRLGPWFQQHVSVDKAICRHHDLAAFFCLPRIAGRIHAPGESASKTWPNPWISVCKSRSGYRIHPRKDFVSLQEEAGAERQEAEGFQVKSNSKSFRFTARHAQHGKK